MYTCINIVLQKILQTPFFSERKFYNSKERKVYIHISM